MVGQLGPNVWRLATGNRQTGQGKQAARRVAAETEASDLLPPAVKSFYKNAPALVAAKHSLLTHSVTH